jgi:hypothetical protein
LGEKKYIAFLHKVGAKILNLFIFLSTENAFSNTLLCR